MELDLRSSAAAVFVSEIQKYVCDSTDQEGQAGPNSATQLPKSGANSLLWLCLPKAASPSARSCSPFPEARLPAGAH